VPPRWLAFGSRASLVTGSPRLSTDPIGSALNLCYSLLEAEARVALAAVGLDAGLAFGLHTDMRSRANGAVDLMEAGRPAADEAVLRVLTTHVFRRTDFAELPNGVCRITPELARELIDVWVPILTAAIAPQAERVAAMLAESRGIETPPTKLTNERRSRGRDALRRQPSRSTASTAALPHVCVTCGVRLREAGRTARYCPECRSEIRAANEDFKKAGRQALADLRARQDDPSRSTEARAKQRASKARRDAERREWDAANSAPDLGEWDAIRAGLAGATLPAIQRATGLSRSFAWQIRRGDRRPHPRHWAALRELVSE
jgi:predicted RNA-binding Zn-ribbon protein involved in translation (DUF1610 family)